MDTFSQSSMLQLGVPTLRLGPPTIDHPFGLALWPIFSRIFKAVMGYPPEHFDFIPGKTPLATLGEVWPVILLYYVVILGGREVMRRRAPLKLDLLFKMHNFGLTAISGVLLALLVEQMLPMLVRNGLFHSICSKSSGWKKELLVIYYLNYLTKYLELFDTLFLVLRKKPLTFLHTYHHGATALLCYTQLVGHSAVQWVPIVLNLAVHVVMYWYYFQAARGIKIWWKKYITLMQITQFVVDLGFVYFATYTGVSFVYAPSINPFGDCAGSAVAATAGTTILSSYLLLFISFYFATYDKKGAAVTKRQ